MVMENDLHKTAEHPSWLELVRDQVRSLRFGHVQIIVHNAQVVQVETTARMRFSAPPPNPDTESSL